MLFVGFFILLALLAAISVVSVAVYLRVYTKRINRRLAGEDTGKAMWSPLRFCLTCAGVFGVLFLVVVVYVAASQTGDQPGGQTQASYQFYTQESMAGTYLEHFSLDENPGYTRHTAQDDHFRYTCFLSQDPYDGMHPSFLVFVQYLGEDLSSYQCDSFQGQFQAEASFGWGGGGGLPEGTVCFVGIASGYQGTFTGTYGLFTFDDWNTSQAAYEETFAKDETTNDLDYASVTAQFTLRFTAAFGTDAMTDTDGVFALGSGQ